MENIPKAIYLQVGEDCPVGVDFYALQEVTWQEEKIFSNDLKFISADYIVGVFNEEVKRQKQNVQGGYVTPRLASMQLEHFARALNLMGANIDDRAACLEINPNHNEDMLAYRTAKPADLAI